MCAAVLGQCGPRVPRFKSLFHSQRYSEEVSFLKGDRQAELQSVWQDIGEDKYAKLEELRHMITAAVDEIYERALEESMRRRITLQDMVTKSENRLKEHLGSTATHMLAPKELPLQVRLNMNMSRLHDHDNARFGGYGWVGGFVVLVELRHRVAVLREMLKLPPCDTFADLDEVLASTTEALNQICPEKPNSVRAFHPLKNDQKPIYQRLQRFYQTLCAMENFCQESFASKETAQGFKDLHCSETSAQFHLQELEVKAAKDGKVDFDKFIEHRVGNQLPSPTISFGFAKRRSGSKSKTKESSKDSKQNSEEASRLEQLSQKILKKLEDINRHVVCATKSANAVFSPSPSYSQMSDVEYSSPSSDIANSSSHLSKAISASFKPASMSPSSDNEAGTPTSVLPDTITKAPNPSYHLTIGISPAHWSGASGESCDSKGGPPMMVVQYKEDESESSIDACWAQLYEKDLVESTTKEQKKKTRQTDSTDRTEMRTLECGSRSAPKPNMAEQEFQDKTCIISEKQTPVPVPCGQKNVPCGQKSTPQPPTRKSSTSLTPPLAPPRPPTTAPPPPPPPPPCSLGLKRLQGSKSSKLKKSITISRLYMGMKRKVDGADLAQAVATDPAVQRRSVAAAANNRDGMAEALAEITRRSSYFRKIEDDVQKHASSIMEIRSALESFETRDMQKLLRFHKSIEAQLEQLTDESQVLARFEGFPIRKLETVRAAASLYLRMSSLAQQIENCPVEPPMSENLDKITNFFDKVKTDVELIERTKDEDISRFQGQKIFFSFEMIVRIKEAVVGLSSRFLALAMKESQRTKGSITIGDEYLSTKDMNKLRASFQMMWKVFQLAFRVHNFAGGHDDKAEQLCCNLAKEMDTYPSSFWLELVNK